ncbi:MAG TPA: alpha-E domain-containing protein [Caulobacteraceae bacterium]|jgi:uncharacterized alpha-E superfamily protein|nr:alpha-E domain-containing protein [Caulobacteraceae bacterium]
MMLARVADSLYWIGRYIERAEHCARLSEVMLNATLDATAAQAAQIAAAAVGGVGIEEAASPMALARALTLNRENPGSVIMSLSSARENARQVRDQITTETWERLNLLYLRAIGPRAAATFRADPPAFLSEIVSDLHLFKGAADATMSHGEGWRFMMCGMHLERSLLISRLLGASFGSRAAVIDDAPSLVGLLRMACALEPYLRVYTADLNPRFILQFLLFDEEFPRSIRYCTAAIDRHLAYLCQGRERGSLDPVRLAGRLNARLAYADIDEVQAQGAEVLLGAVEDEGRAIHEAMYESFVAYPLEARLPT